MMSSRRAFVGGATLGVLGLASLAAKGGVSTPFLEGNNKVGDVSEGQARLLWLEGDNYLAVVRSDEDEYFAVRATAKAGVVIPTHLGRPVTVKAKVTSNSPSAVDRHPVVVIDILAVK